MIVDNPITHVMTCRTCGATWQVTPAKGQAAVTATHKDNEANRHFRECPGPSKEQA